MHRGAIKEEWHIHVGGAIGAGVSRDASPRWNWGGPVECRAGPFSAPVNVGRNPRHVVCGRLPVRGRYLGRGDVPRENWRPPHGPAQCSTWAVALMVPHHAPRRRAARGSILGLALRAGAFGHKRYEERCELARAEFWSRFAGCGARGIVVTLARRVLGGCSSRGQPRSARGLRAFGNRRLWIQGGVFDPAVVSAG